jgi:hypothetical protein
VITATELMVFLSDRNAMATRVDDLSDLIRRGFVELTYADDAIVGLSATSSAPTLPTLPLAAA